MTTQISLPLSGNLFTLQEYRTFMEEYRAQRNAKRYNTAWQQRLWELHAIYRSRLPIYLLARCPFCGGRVWESVDTYSLRGFGWQAAGQRGYGWYGPVSTIPPAPRRSNADSLETEPSYQADCSHVLVTDWCVNLNKLTPSDVSGEVWLLTEVPHLISLPMLHPGVMAVMHALPVGRYDDATPQPRYTAYFTTYFAESAALFETIYDPVFKAVAEANPSLLVSGGFDYDLVQWVKAGRLFWLDQADPDLPLRHQPADAFPYANVQGHKGPIKIFAGQIKQEAKTLVPGWLQKLLGWGLQ